MPPRYLTKSRFKTALECPTKLYFTGKHDYVNARSEDAFMQALADGGFQVGELAKLMHPDGIEVAVKDHGEALRQTNALLERDEVTIFEAAVSFGTLFVRIDILKKRGDRFELIEVKARSYSADDRFTNTRNAIKPGILPYLQDVAFQLHVLRGAFPGREVASFLMFADKTARASVDQLNQRFKIVRQGSQHRIDIAPGTDSAAIGAPILAKVGVSELVEQILGGLVRYPGGEQTFAQAVAHFANHYGRDQRIAPVLGAQCGKCEFRTAEPDPRSGFHECWKAVTKWSDADFARGTVLDLWNFRGKDALIRAGIFGLGQVDESDLKNDAQADRLTRGNRQWMQVSGQWPGGGQYFLDRDGLEDVHRSFRYPLHFIDFETSRTAIPFHIGRTPYEQVAFQFSHHVMGENGSVTHAGQFLEAAPGVFPNYAFVRELRRQLAGDQGTILRWASHENSVLRDIWRQLAEDTHAPADKVELQEFILSITTDDERIGERTMVDLCKIAEHYYFHPLTKGSCSIKKVLPAVMHSSPVLRQQYGAPVYGSAGGPSSLNFENWTWWQAEAATSAPLDPYKLLPPVFEGLESADESERDDSESLANGGAAMTAYARLQFELLSDTERTRLAAALLKYCELDTLAMVMIWQAWQADIADYKQFY